VLGCMTLIKCHFWLPTVLMYVYVRIWLLLCGAKLGVGGSQNLSLNFLPVKWANHRIPPGVAVSQRSYA
jgi:hypothetical protein